MERRRHGLRIDGGDVIVHQKRDGRFDFARTRDLPTGPVDPVPAFDAAAAEGVARAATNVASGARADRRELILVPSDGALRLAWEVFLFSDDPVARWRVLVDATNGSVLRTVDMVRNVSGTGQVFVPNAVVALQDNTIEDTGDADAAIPAAAYEVVTLQGLDAASGGSFHLTGSFVYALDVEAPHTAPPAEPTASFVYTRANDNFEWVMVYYHLDEAQRFIQSLGFSNVNNRKVEVDAHGLNGADNAHYVPSGIGTGYLAFGDGGVDDGEDADVILHEYGHSVQDNQCPNCFFGDESGAMGEGFGDFLAVAFFLPASSGFQDTCFADWDSTSYSSANPPCLRRVDKTKHYPESIVGEVHADGEIWSALLWDILLAFSGGPTPTVGARDTIVKIVLESHFLVPSDPSFFEGAQALLDADEALFAGANQAVLADRIAARGLTPPPPSIFGGGSKSVDCTGAYVYENPTNPRGFGSNSQECHDNDPTCDSDAIVGQCTFRMSYCLGRAGLLGCQPQRSIRFEMSGPRPDNRKPSLATIGENFTAAVAAIPGGVRGGKHNEVVTWTPFLEPGSCTADIDVVVPMRFTSGTYRKTSIGLRTLAVMSGNFKDRDSLRLKCVP